ncbi:MAG TPA: amino acid adenylation domain-containing protein [Pyrinomonadaceae bacterium]
MSKTADDLATLTPEQRAVLELRLREKRVSAAGPRQVIERAERDTDTFPLSFGQQRLWFVQRLSPNSHVYNIPHALRLEGPLDPRALEEALTEIVRRHEILRTTFRVRDGEPVQVIGPTRRVEIKVEDYSGLGEAEREAEVLRAATQRARTVVDMERGPLFRAYLFRLAHDEHVLLVCMHHILSDGWSLGVFYRELEALYAAFSEGRPSPLAEPPIQYVDFALWQRDYLKGEVLERHLDYWRAQLSGSLTPLELPTDRPRPAVQTFAGATESRLLPAYMTAALEELSRQAGATMFMTTAAAFQTQLHLYTGRADVVIGTATANRTREEFEGLIGFFTNTLVLRADLSGNPTFRELLGRVRESALGAYAHQDVPFEKLVEEVEPKHNLSYSPLFQVGFLFEEAASQPIRLRGLRVRAFNVEDGSAKWDISLALANTRRGLLAMLDYNTDLFDPETVRRMLGHLEQLLKTVIANPDARLSELSLLTDAERKQLVDDYNATEEDFPREFCFHNLFERQAERMGDAPALCCADEQLSYEQLNAAANQLAHHLITAGIGPEHRVAICLERSPRMVIALLAINKAGGAYVPLNEHWPPNRLHFILEDANVSAVLTQRSLRHLLPTETDFPVWSLDEEWPQISRNPRENPPPRAAPDNLIYVYYTSGSTGIPKGVMMGHRGVVNYATLIPRPYDLRSRGRTLVHSPFSFDLTLTGLLPPLMVGAAIELVNPGDELEGVGEQLSDPSQRYSLIKITPSHLLVLSNWLGERGINSGNVDALIIGGEALPGETLRYWQEQPERRRLINEYGPTETVVGCSIFEVPGAERYNGLVPIGRPISNMQMYVLDPALRPLPAGVIGEIYIGGEGVARGYLGLPALTAERFVPDPFSARPGRRLYRSGDLGRMRADGEMEYLGRTDEQVKIRGFRIELGEIESVLRQHEAVKESAVVVQGTGGDKRLVGYAVLREDSSGDEESKKLTWADIREYLKRELPEYMVPVDVMLLERMPLTSNGKIDRKALPLPAEVHLTAGGSYVAPGSELEARVAEMWQEILNVRPIGVTDNFFERGGHSLLVVRVLARVEQEFGRELTISEFFQQPTVRGVAQMLEREEAEEIPTLVTIQRGGHRTPIFFVHALGGDVGYYNRVAQYLGEDRPVYALQAPYPIDLAEYVSVEEMAAHYVNEICKAYPLGPYHVGGYSFGSVVAFAMAQELKRRGLEVGLLVLLEGGSPRLLKNMHGGIALMTIAGLARDLARLAGVDIDLRHEEVQKLGLERGMEVIVERLRDAKLLSDKVGIPWMRRYIRGALLRSDAVKNYEPEVYDGVITLIRATESEPESQKALMELGVDVHNPTLGWEQLTTKPLVVRRIAGFHVTMVEEPYVQELAEQLRARLGETEMELNGLGPGLG